MTDLHASLLTLDSHIDIPWPDGDDPFRESPNRRVDLPKMRAGGLGAGCFAAYVPQGRLDAAGHAEAGARAFAMLDRIAAMGEPRDGILTRLCTTAEAIERAHAEGAIAIVPAIENAYALGDDLSVIARYRAKGACYVTLTHNGHNLIADSAIPRRDLGDGEIRHGGLSPLGREAVAEMNRVGMLVDVSHLSRAAMLQAAQLSATPVVATHSSVRALCDHRRNLDDDQLDALRDTGGVIQVTAMPGFLRTRREQAPSPEVGRRRSGGSHRLRGAPDRPRPCRHQLRLRWRRCHRRLEQRRRDPGRDGGAGTPRLRRARDRRLLERQLPAPDAPGGGDRLRLTTRPRLRRHGCGICQLEQSGTAETRSQTRHFKICPRPAIDSQSFQRNARLC